MIETDLTALREYLDQVAPELSGANIVLTKFSGGQSNPTYLMDNGREQFVLRRQPEGEVLTSAHAVGREARVMNALGAVGYPAPEILHVCNDSKVIGSDFVLMEYVDGRIFWDPALPETTPEERTPIYMALTDALADLHLVDIDAAGLGDFGPRSDYFERQVSRWSWQMLSAGDPLPHAERLERHLMRSRPANEAMSLVHGDFRLDNVIFAKDSARVDAVIDWELATLGNPLADLGYYLLSWVVPIGPSGGAALARGDLADLNIPDLDRVIDRYFTRTQFARPDDFSYYFAYNLYRVAAILHGIGHRAKHGNASSTKAASVASLAAPAIDLALEFINGS